MTTETKTIAHLTADLGDELAAGMPFPQRDALASPRREIPRLFRARRAFWIAASEGYLAQAIDGSVEALYDAQQALANASHYTPKEN